MNIIQQFINNDWLDRLTNSKDFALTEAGIGYAIMYNINLSYALEDINDTNEVLSGYQQRDRLAYNNFNYIGGGESYSVWHKTGRMITQVDNRLSFIYQYRGKLPKILRKSSELSLSEEGVYTGHQIQSTALCSINDYMDSNGDFIEPWDMSLFDDNTRARIERLFTFLPNDFLDTIQG